MKTVLIVQNSGNPNEQWQKEVELKELVPIGYRIIYPLTDRLKFFIVDEARLYPNDHPIKDESRLELIQRINPQMLETAELQKYGWQKILQDQSL